MDERSCMVMILADGQGGRLSPLSDKLAKSAVLFGMNYRLVDFSLSNCANSSMNRVVVSTPYQSESLHTYIGDGKPWGLHKENGGKINFLPSNNRDRGGYLGTADAIYRHIDMIDQQQPEYVLITSAEQIYQMDYRELLGFHRSTGASATISVVKLPTEENSPFGIIDTDSSSRVTDFIANPKQSDDQLSSMGIYMFQWSFLKKLLLLDAHNSQSSHDMTKDIIPLMLATDNHIFAYLFSGYWRHISTTESLWRAHMDWLDDRVFGLVNENNWPITSRLVSKGIVRSHYPQHSYYQSFLHPDTHIDQYVSRSIICSGVDVGKNSMIRESVIMPNVTIGRNVRIHRAIVGEGAIIKSGTVVGDYQDNITVIAPNAVVNGIQQPFLNMVLS